MCIRDSAYIAFMQGTRGMHGTWGQDMAITEVDIRRLDRVVGLRHR